MLRRSLGRSKGSVLYLATPKSRLEHFSRGDYALAVFDNHSSRYRITVQPGRQLSGWRTVSASPVSRSHLRHAGFRNRNVP